MTHLEGLPAAPGAARAPAWWITAAAPPVEGRDAEAPPAVVETELARLDDALERAGAELEELATRVAETAGQDEAAIFEAHAAFVADPELVEAARAAVREGARAERATREAFDEVRAVLAASSSEYLAARAADLDDVRDRVVRKLTGADGEAAGPDEPVVILADELSPSQTAELDLDRVRAVATRRGSPTSHAAILARSLGIPAVVGVRDLGDVGTGIPVGVDGDRGLVLVEPTEDEASQLDARARGHATRRERLAELRDEPGATADGVRVELAANVGSEADLAAASTAGAEGVGLLRTEFLYLDRADPPSLEEQTEAYAQALAWFPGARVVLRTLDAGADKPLPFAARDDEPNPALGLRGIRLSLRTPEVFADQLRAVLRAAAAVGPDAARPAIMLPLVSVPAEVEAAQRILARVADEEDVDLATVELGAMVEVPAAALRARALAERCDFLSIGTNDLLQYLFAADRLVGEIADLADLLDPAALALVRDVINAGHGAGCWVGVCGEAAADLPTAAVLCGLGVDELSMAPASIPEVKDLLRRHDHATLRGAAEQGLAATDAEAARAAVRRAVGLDESAAPADPATTAGPAER